jgi:RNA polymerase sigma-70 factor (ECF subfamily)
LAEDPRSGWWSAFYQQHRSALGAWALSLTGNESDAQDLIQDVMLRLIVQSPVVNHAPAFVMRCMRNLAIDRKRTARTRERHDRSIAARHAESSDAGGNGTPIADGSHRRYGAGPHDALERRDEAARVRAALARLSGGRREVVVLKVYSGLTFREIAQVLDRPAGSVASDYARALDELAAMLEEGAARVP